MALYAVINGDIIGSTKMTEKKRARYLGYLKSCFNMLEKEKSFGVLGNFEMYRGDSFQGALSKPEKVLRVALLLRSLSRMHGPAQVKVPNKTTTTSRNSQGEITDLRLAIGIGSITKLASKLMESDGEAFHRSGHLIDSMKKRGMNMSIDTPSEKFNKELEASWALVDTIVSKWTSPQAEVVYFSLMGHTQNTIAGKKIKTTPSAINQRLRGAGWSALEKMVLYFEDSLSTKIKL